MGGSVSGSLSVSQVVRKSVEIRKQLHAIPETNWEEVKTSAFLKHTLDVLGVEWRNCASPGVLAHVAHKAKGPRIAFRADMDGLLLEEKSSVGYRSKHHGYMHGCGHDGHMAVLLGVVSLLKHYEKSLPGPVSFIFQPAEEGGHGAREMIKDGVLEGVDFIYGWHNWPPLPFGQIACPAGPVMAANGSFTVTVTGRGGHASQPELCRDPVLAAAALTLSLQQIVSRRLPSNRAGVVSVTSIDARSGETTIPDTAMLSGSVRMQEDTGISEVGEMIKTIAEATCAAYGVEPSVNFTPRYPAVTNDAKAAAKMRATLEQYFPKPDASPQPELPIMASEDFSYYLQKIPGAFALVGASDSDAHSRPCHSGDYLFNDKLVEPMIRCLCHLAGIILD